MSIYSNIEELSWETRQQINKDLEIEIENKYGDSRYIYPFEIDDENIKLPFAYAASTLHLKRPNRQDFPSMKIIFEGTPRPEQEEILKESTALLNKNGSIMISAYTGAGKTACSIKLACRTGFKTLVIVNKLILMKQWESSLLKFCPTAKVQCLTTKSKKKNCDFYIMNAQNIKKMGKTFFSDIGTVIVDEAHLIMAETLSLSLQYVYPRYLIGLTATPYRPDGLDILLELYFGKHKIIRKLWRKHTAYKITSGFKPTIKYSKNGKVNWGAVLDSQANDEGRNEMLIKLIKHFPDKNILVLVKRVSQGEYLIKRLEEEGEYVTSLIGKNQEYDVSARILVGTGQKVGFGFDHPKLNTLLLAADVEQYFIQYLGRVFRTKEVEPIILDIVDNYGILHKHFLVRRKIYQDHGGIVKNFDLDILD